MDKRSLALLGISLILAFGMGEVAMRVYANAFDEVIVSSEEERCSRTAYLKATGNSSRRFSPSDTSYLEYSPITGITPKANTWLDTYYNSTLRDGRQAIVQMFDARINNIRARSSFNVTSEPLPNVTRIIAIGDSFTWGAEAGLMFSYPYLLEAMAKETEVINFGIEGIGIDTMYLRWKYEALPLKPKAVIFTIYFDDLARARPCIHKPRLEVREGKIVISNMPPPTYEQIANMRPRGFESLLLKRAMYTWRYRVGVRETEFEEGFKLLGPILDEMKRVSAERGILLMVLLIERPNHNLRSEEGKRASDRAVSARIFEMSTDRDIITLSSEQIFKENGFIPLDYFGGGKIGHFRADGNSYLAQGIANTLAANGVTHEQIRLKYFANETPHLLVIQDPRNPEQRLELVDYIEILSYDEKK